MMVNAVSGIISEQARKQRTADLSIDVVAALSRCAAGYMSEYTAVRALADPSPPGW